MQLIIQLTGLQNAIVFTTKTVPLEQLEEAYNNFSKGISGWGDVYNFTCTQGTNDDDVSNISISVANISMMEFRKLEY